MLAYAWLRLSKFKEEQRLLQDLHGQPHACWGVYASDVIGAGRNPYRHRSEDPSHTYHHSLPVERPIRQDAQRCMVVMARRTAELIVGHVWVEMTNAPGARSGFVLCKGDHFLSGQQHLAHDLQWGL